MEILTEKAKSDFEKWLHNNYATFCNKFLEAKEICLSDDFTQLPEIVQISLIIEWLDSVGLFISIDPFRLNDTFGGFGSTVNLDTPDITSRICLATREQAIRKAIVSANVMYNERVYINTPKGRMWFSPEEVEQVRDWERKNLNQ